MPPTRFIVGAELELARNAYSTQVARLASVRVAHDVMESLLLSPPSFKRLERGSRRSARRKAGMPEVSTLTAVSLSRILRSTNNQSMAPSYMLTATATAHVRALVALLLPSSLRVSHLSCVSLSLAAAAAADQRHPTDSCAARPSICLAFSVGSSRLVWLAGRRPLSRRATSPSSISPPSLPRQVGLAVLRFSRSSWPSRRRRCRPSRT